MEIWQTFSQVAQYSRMGFVLILMEGMGLKTPICQQNYTELQFCVLYYIRLWPFSKELSDILNDVL